MSKPTVPEVLLLVHKLYRRHMAGCCLHIVLDDGNTRDSDVQFCINWAQTHGHKECEELGEKLMLMSRTQRAKVYGDTTKYNQVEL